MAILVAAAAVLLLAPIAAADSVDTVALHDTVLPTLYIAYSTNCTLSVTNDSGQSVSSVAPGTYNISITTPGLFANAKGQEGPNDFTDCKGEPSFQLTGPGVSDATSLDDGSNDHALFTENLQAGATYVAVDLNQPTVARVAISVTSSGTPSTPSNPYTPGTSPSTPSSSKDVVGSQTPKTTPFRGTLLGTVSPAGKATLTLKGRSVGSLKAGKYTFTVTDRSKAAGFTVQLIKQGATIVTTSAYEGKKSVTISLKAGQWFFYPSFVGKKTYFLVTN